MLRVVVRVKVLGWTSDIGSAGGSRTLGLGSLKAARLLMQRANFFQA